MARYFVIKRNNSEEMHIVPDDYEIIPNNIISGGFIALGEGEEFFCYSDTSLISNQEK